MASDGNFRPSARHINDSPLGTAILYDNGVADVVEPPDDARYQWSTSVTDHAHGMFDDETILTFAVSRFAFAKVAERSLFAS